MLINLLAFEFDIHRTLVLVLRDSTDTELLLDTYNVVALICTSPDSSHVIKFVNLGVMDLIKQRLALHLSDHTQESF